MWVGLASDANELASDSSLLTAGWVSSLVDASTKSPLSEHRVLIFKPLFCSPARTPSAEEEVSLSDSRGYWATSGPDAGQPDWFQKRLSAVWAGEEVGAIASPTRPLT